MKKKKGLFLIVVSIFMITSNCMGQPVSTKDLLMTPQDLIRAQEAPELAPPSKPVVADKSNQPPSAGSILPDRDAPQKAGAVIVWTGTATDPEGDTILYQFWLNGPSTGNIWKPMNSWSESNVWNWTTNEVDTGNNIIDMRVRDGRHAGAEKWDSHLSAEYFIESGNIFDPGNKPVLLGLRSDRQSPQDLGIKVVWTAEALDPEGDTILYQFWLKGPSTEEQWIPVTSWTTSNQWIWNTAQSRAGIYTIEAKIRDGYHSGAESSDDFRRMPYILRQIGIIK